MTNARPTFVRVESSDVGPIVHELVLKLLLVSDEFGHGTPQRRVLEHHQQANTDHGGPGDDWLQTVRYASEPEFGQMRSSQCDQRQNSIRRFARTAASASLTK